jgi:hypothetical protein
MRGLRCYLRSMKNSFQESAPDQIPAPFNEQARLNGPEWRQMERRANFARAYMARGRTLGNGRKLDPVLASHLGLQEPAK